MINKEAVRATAIELGIRYKSKIAVLKAWELTVQDLVQDGTDMYPSRPLGKLGREVMTVYNAKIKELAQK